MKTKYKYITFAVATLFLTISGAFIFQPEANAATVGTTCGGNPPPGLCANPGTCSNSPGGVCGNLVCCPKSATKSYFNYGACGGLSTSQSICTNAPCGTGPAAGFTQQYTNKGQGGIACNQNCCVKSGTNNGGVNTGTKNGNTGGNTNNQGGNNSGSTIGIQCGGAGVDSSCQKIGTCGHGAGGVCGANAECCPNTPTLCKTDGSVKCNAGYECKPSTGTNGTGTCVPTGSGGNQTKAGKGESCRITASDKTGGCQTGLTCTPTNPSAVGCNTADADCPGTCQAPSVKLNITSFLQDSSPNPVNKTVTAIAKVYPAGSTSTTQAILQTGTLTYDPARNAFVNDKFDLGSLPPGNYQIILHIDKYIDAQFKSGENTSTFVTIGNDTLNSQPINMIPGDVAPGEKGDNFVDISDYNKVLGCKDKAPTGTCKLDDVNNDGVINQIDIDIVLKYFGSLGFSLKKAGFSCQIDPKCETGKTSLQLCPLLCTKQTTD
jgi:hypothetical protein